MNVDFKKNGPRLVEITREFFRTKDVEAWMDAYCAICAEAVPGRVDDVANVAQQMAGAAMSLLNPAERIRLASALMSVPNLVGRLQMRIRAIKAQREVPS